MIELLAHSADAEESVFERALVRIFGEGQLDIACPYLDPGYLERLTVGVDWRLITDGDESLGALAGDARAGLLAFFADHPKRVRHKSLLHAKVFIGATKALVGSSNLTSNGLLKRDEVGLLVDGPLVDELRVWFDELWSKSIPFTLDEASKRKVKEKRERSSVQEGRVLPDNASRKTYLKSVIKGRRKKRDRPCPHEDHRERLLAAIGRSPSREWIDGYFDLLKRAIEETGLSNDDKRLVTTTPKEINTIRLNINNRQVLSAYHRGANAIGFILPRSFVITSDLMSRKTKYNPEDPFRPVGKDEALENTPYFFAFTTEVLSDIPQDFLAVWQREVVRNVSIRNASPYKDHHNPLVYRAAVDLDFRKQLLDEAFGGDR